MGNMVRQKKKNNQSELNNAIYQRINLLLSILSTICIVIGLFYTAYSINVNTKTDEFYSLLESFEKFNNSLTLEVDNSHQKKDLSNDSVILKGNAVIEEIYIYQKANQHALRQTFNKYANIVNVFNANVGDVIVDSDNNKYEVVERKKKEINSIREIINKMRLVAIPLLNSLEKMPNSESYQRIVVSNMSRLYLEVILDNANRTGDRPNYEIIKKLIDKIEFVGLPFQDDK
ncbi:hypothetical protein E4N94_06290 [Treponema denticola]|uniref:hypothetical protein n=1 Tax=Treponema denticola TaxID=158 RepID=UPI003D931198